MLLKISCERSLRKSIKNIKILHMLMSNHSKHYMGMTNINFVFHQVPPCKQERGGKRQKE